MNDGGDDFNFDMTIVADIQLQKERLFTEWASFSGLLVQMMLVCIRMTEMCQNIAMSLNCTMNKKDIHK